MSTSLTLMKVIFQTVTLCDKQFSVVCSKLLSYDNYIEFLFMRWPLQHRLYKSGLCNGRAMIWQEGTPVNTSHSMCYWSSSNPCHIIEISYGCICHNLQINHDYIIHLANSEPSATLYSEGEYCLPELPVVENRGEENKTAYQALDLDSTDYTSMYSKIQGVLQAAGTHRGEG